MTQLDRDYRYAAHLDRLAEARECGVCQYCQGDEITGHTQNCRIFEHLAADDAATRNEQQKGAAT